ncbi:MULTISPECIES: arsenic resistance protein [Haematobacter]|uniref:Arsenic resistance protein n=2 Tax=Haematobacter TaxID=366614 RepID=A0A086XTZ9_9RHOB|nr:MULTISPECIES: arsenic resistance protein [Haematobacter]KFI25499.1 arsenic resistance protein [Haematobacter massiliensis]OWJ69556.1 arsenic resistance protein [Haematobacter massiliensis]OWJ74976.1 arsenic resistance protein [Haematobacter genomosp. 1]OWJ85727.1 arsenic resistance protein [Haematobacter massiliensis]
MRDILERQQVWIYFAAVGLAAITGITVSGTTALEGAINPALAFMLFVTFLQVPLPDIGRGFREMRFLCALLAGNFIAVPVLVFLLLQLAIDDALLRLGILMVLLTPCIDYVITFAHLGRADARLLLSSTPLLLVVQMALLPIFLGLFLGSEAADLVHVGPFIHAFVWLIAVPLMCAGAVQLWAARHAAGRRVSDGLGVLPVPATAVVLFLVVAATVPVLGAASRHALSALPIFIAFAVLAPFIGWGAARIFVLQPAAGRAVSFSIATRNSLVVLPLALAVPGAIPVLPAVIVTQTLVELVAELIYIRVLPRFGRALNQVQRLTDPSAAFSGLWTSR